MLSSVAKVLLTSTSIAPVGLTYAWVAWFNGDHIFSGLAVAASLTLVLICIWMLRYAKKNLEHFNFSVSTVEAADRENMGFLLLYLLPLFTSSFGALNWMVWVPTLIIFAIITSTGYSYHFNPLLGVMKWHFYKVGTPEGVTYVLITKKELRRASSPLIAAQLTEYIVIDVED
ncbi:hypothetical protein [Pseudomonas sp.]|uniref:hypothetical protein n=1 Tax=Pseudomonas sp. TaxID=306 RepID=UPI003A982BC8